MKSLKTFYLVRPKIKSLIWTWFTSIVTFFLHGLKEAIRINFHGIIL